MTDKLKTTPPPSEVANTQIVAQPENSLQAEANDYDIDGFLAKRKEFIEKVNSIMVEKADYHVIQGKKSLAKGGAEKIASIFGWQSAFTGDEDVISAFKLDGLIAFKCTVTKNGMFVGEGRGAATLSKNGSDANKTVKMAQKSAFIDAVLRASGLSDFFTQDLEDMPANTVQRPELGVERRTREESERRFQTPQAEYYCETHDRPLVLRPAGVSKQGKEYPAFWACTEKTDGKFCKGPFTDTEGNRVKQNPETGKMEVIEKVHEAEIVFDKTPVESSVDKARRILNATVPKPYTYPEGD